MHDPQTVAFEVRNPFVKRHGYHPSIITIWHVDPEKKGYDDSCGFFIRLFHADKNVFEKVVKEFSFEFEKNYWFHSDGSPRFSTGAIVMEMYSRAIWQVLPEKRRSKGRTKFMRKYLWDILHFAENPVDSLNNYIVNESRYRLIQHDRSKCDSQEERIRHFANVVYCDILRKLRPWYKHPRWHIHHWRIQVHPWQQLRRRYWDKCEGCGKRGFRGSAYGQWDGKKIWHEQCYPGHKPIATNEPPNVISVIGNE